MAYRQKFILFFFISDRQMGSVTRTTQFLECSITIHILQCIRDVVHLEYCQPPPCREARLKTSTSQHPSVTPRLQAQWSAVQFGWVIRILNRFAAMHHHSKTTLSVTMVRIIVVLLDQRCPTIFFSFATLVSNKWPRLPQFKDIAINPYNII